jgi:hypothetical protein
MASYLALLTPPADILETYIVVANSYLVRQTSRR